MADEYCFLWIKWWATCLTKDAWSSWVQAIGTILALLLAGLLAWWESHRRRIEADVRTADALMARVMILEILAGQLVQYQAVLKAHGSADSNAFPYGAFRGLKNIVEETRLIELREMPTQICVLAMANARSIAVLLLETFEKTDSGRWMTKADEDQIKLASRVIKQSIAELTEEATRLRR